MHSRPDDQTLVDDIAEKATRGPLLFRLARAGYLAKGVIYLALGLLLAEAARDLFRAPPDANTGDALLAIARQPFGIGILVAVLVGLVGYVLWRLYQAVADSERKGSDLKGLAQCLGYVGSASFYAGTAYSAFKILQGIRTTDDSYEDWTARLLGGPFGPWLIGGAGLLLILVGGFQAWRGIKQSFLKEVRLHEMSKHEQAAYGWLGRVGLVARGVVYGLIGYFLLQAAIRYDAETAGGLGESLARVATYSTAPLLFGLVGAGLVAYSLYTFADARYRRFPHTT